MVIGHHCNIMAKVGGNVLKYKNQTCNSMEYSTITSDSVVDPLGDPKW